MAVSCSVFMLTLTLTLVKKLVLQIGARPVLETQLCFEAPGDLWINIIKMQPLRSG